MFSTPRLSLALLLGSFALANAQSTASISPLRLTASEHPAGRQTIWLSTRGEAVLSVHATSQGHSFENPGSPAAVVRIFVDGELASDLVLHHGVRPFRYRRMLGDLSAGPHQLEFRLHRAIGNHENTVVNLRHRRSK